MKLGSGKAKTGPDTRQAVSGRPLWVYLAPAPVAAAVLLLVMLLAAQQWLQAGERETARRGMQQVAEAAAGQVAGAVASARELLRLLAADPRVSAALAGGADARSALAEQLRQQAVPHWLQLRLLPPDWDRPDPTGAAPMGYAGVDLLRRTANAEQVPGEVHQLNSGAPYLALAEPVRAQGAVAGTLFAALPLRTVTGPVAERPDMPGRLWLSQQVEGGRVALGVASEAEAQSDGAAAVPGTRFEVAYRVAPRSAATGLLLLLGVMVLGLGLLLAVTFLQSRLLARELRADLGAAVALGEAILNRQGAAPPVARLRPVADTLMLLAKYAQRGRGGAPPPAGAAGAGQAPPAPAAQQARDDIEVEELDGADVALAEVAAGGPRPVLPEQVFRGYDIRGLAGDELTPEGVALLGQALGTLVQEQGGQNLVVGRDARESSPKLAAALAEGILASGLDVIDIGAAPTPLGYFGRAQLESGGVVMVTGSHNAVGYNGFKIQLGDRMLAGDRLHALRERMADGELVRGKGGRVERDLADDYLQRVLGDVALARELRIVVDAGNGVAGPLALELFGALGCDVTPLYCDPDGSFPHHHPDPGQPENLVDLAATVRATGADLGIALDGDGDRLGLVDSAGEAVWPDQLLMLLAADVLVRHPGADILYDVKSSRHIAGFVLANGGRPIMTPSGHARMKDKLAETGALLAGEFAGHYYVKERWYGFDDALYAAARTLEILSADARPSAEIFADLPSSPATPELYLAIAEGRGPALMADIAARADFPEAKIVDMDGLRVEFADGWGLVRASNTSPALTFRFEADDAAALERVQAAFRGLLGAVDPDLALPF